MTAVRADLERMVTLLLESDIAHSRAANTLTNSLASWRP